MFRNAKNTLYSGYLRVFGTAEEYWRNCLETDFPCEYLDAIPKGDPKTQYETLTLQKNQLIGFLKEHYIYFKWGTAEDVSNLLRRASEPSWTPRSDEELKQLFTALHKDGPASSKMHVEDYAGFTMGFMNQVMVISESLAGRFNHLFFMSRVMDAYRDDLEKTPFSERERFNDKTGQEKLDELLLASVLGAQVIATLSFLAKKKYVELLSYYVSNEIITLDHRINYDLSLRDIIEANGLDTSKLDRIGMTDESGELKTDSTLKL